MSTGREKDQKDFDLEQIVRIIDQALESDDQRIKDSLRQLMTITVLCTAEHPDQTLRNGPLARVFEDYNNLARRLSSLEDDVRKIQWDQQKQKVEPFAPPYNPGSPFGPNPTTGWPGTNDPTKPTPMWESTWSAGDDPNYKGASSTGIHNV
jgi:hypothetical protein